ncbi:FkbM family methyltransferase [Thermodesulfobacteriota bacterium]
MRRQLSHFDRLVRYRPLVSIVRSILGGLTSVPRLAGILRSACGKGLIPKKIWKFFPVESQFEVVLPKGESFMYAVTHGDAVGKGLYWQGLESLDEEFEVFYRLSAHSSSILDIGANTGVYPLIACAANRQASVTAFEPVPAVYDRLVENVAVNGFKNRCVTRREAVSDKVGTAQLIVPPGLVPLEASLIDSRSLEDRQSEDISVPTMTIDHRFRNTVVDLVKIDVEGFEDLVLRGMLQVLDRDRPVLIIEHHTNSPSDKLDLLLGDVGYQLYRIKSDGTTGKVNGFRVGVRDHYLCVHHRRMVEVKAALPLPEDGMEDEEAAGNKAQLSVKFSPAGSIALCLLETQLGYGHSR